MKLALISSYGEACGNATFSLAIAKTFRDKFDFRVFDLQTAALIANESLHNTPGAEEHIDRICDALKDFDCVNIQLEWGLFGRDPDTIRRRIIKLIKASHRLIISLHSLHINEHNRLMQNAVFQALKERDNSLPYWFIVHLPRDVIKLRSIFGIENVTDYPVIHLSEKEVKDYHARADAAMWKQRHGFNKDDFVIFRSGFMAPHKDHMVSLKALRLLPPNYKLAYGGSEPPAAIQKFVVSPIIQDITTYLDSIDDAALRERAVSGTTSAGTLGDRVRFLGMQSDEDLYLSMCCADMITITHLESGQSASGIASIALQLERPTILSYNKFFIDNEKYYRGGFSFFQIGNHYELRDKIMTFDYAQTERLKEYGKIYSIDGLAELHKKIYADMVAGRVNNSGRKSNMLAAVIDAPPPPPPSSASHQPQHNEIAARQQEVNRIIYAVLWRAVLFAKRMRSFLRQRRDDMNNMKRTILKPFS